MAALEPGLAMVAPEPELALVAPEPLALAPVVLALALAAEGREPCSADSGPFVARAVPGNQK
jgi:hypothetical protein